MTEQPNNKIVRVGNLSTFLALIKQWVTGKTTPMQAELDDHDNLLHPIELTLESSAGTLVEDDGTAHTTAITATAKRKGKNGALTCTIKSLSKGMQTISDPAAAPLTSGANSFMANVEVHEGSTSADGIITPKLTTELGSINVTLIAARRYGAAATATLTTAAMEAISKQPLATGPALPTLSITEAAPFYLWLCVPQSMTIAKVTSSGFDVPMAEPQDLNDSQGVAYKAYRSQNEIAAGSHTFKVE